MDKKDSSNKKYLLIIGIIILILCVVGAFLYFNNANTNPKDNSTFTVGQAEFTLPEGYKVTETKNDSAKISNKFNTVSIVCYNDKNIKKYVNKYIKMKEKENHTVNLSNITINNHMVYKSELDNDSSNVHYWFKYGNSTYSLYSADANKHMDSLANQLIRSMKANN